MPETITARKSDLVEIVSTIEKIREELENLQEVVHIGSLDSLRRRKLTAGELRKKCYTLTLGVTGDGMCSLFQ
jgi:hypothetical protein